MTRGESLALSMLRNRPAAWLTVPQASYLRSFFKKNGRPGAWYMDGELNTYHLQVSPVNGAGSLSVGGGRVNRDRADKSEAQEAFAQADERASQQAAYTEDRRTLRLAIIRGQLDPNLGEAALDALSVKYPLAAEVCGHGR